jgi:hypothetical protein
MKRRTFLKGGVAALGVGGARPSVVLGQAKPFAGVTINGACFQHVYQTYLQAYIPEFEERTGMKVNFTLQAFPVYNQRADLELSTKGSAWDFLNVTFIYSGRWIGAGWMTPLDEFVNDRNLTPAEWDFRDFVPGAQSTLQDAKGLTYGLAWEAGAMIMGASRGDLIEKAGLRLPETFEQLVQVCEATNNKDGVSAFVADRLHHWNWIPYLMGYGGRVFKDPPVLSLRVERLLLRPHSYPDGGDDGAGGRRQLHELRGLGVGKDRGGGYARDAARAAVLVRGTQVPRSRPHRRRPQGLRRLLRRASSPLAGRRGSRRSSRP